MTYYTRDEICELIPHRYENLLLDTCESDTTSSAQFSLSIHHGHDPLNREIFTGSDAHTPCYLLAVVVPELLALAGICSMVSAFPGHYAFFAGISNFECESLLDLSKPLTGTVFPGSTKHTFYKYNGEVQDQHGHKATAQITAFFSTQFLKAPVLPACELNSRPFTLKPSYKSADMFLVDGIIECSESLISTSYHYKASHPLTKGHFPESPLMMGIMQWMSVEDALYVYAIEHQIEPTRLICNAEITRVNDQKVAAIIQDCEVLIGKDASGYQARIVKTKRIQFKEAISIGHTLQIDCRDIRTVTNA